MKVRPSALIWRHRDTQPEVLLMHYRYGEVDVLALPGGNPDRGETLPQTVAREVQEELGLTVSVGEMVMAGEMLLMERADDVLHIVFATRDVQGEPLLNPAETSALAIRWVAVSDLHTLNLYPNVGEAVQRWFASGGDLGYIGRIEQRYFG
ncbi:NUDIX domain-containing protein [Rudanella paleaurantiibacter]|uniref:NUDIX domain-containing protein n=1 Tax=Rudanella paleaurantiibacter TaxID=2614655 RepID=A0A7J5U2H1_9BACT|nr:NUDIX hydrolase [Rudanella paleaurantiibacter]KAB7731772.1 NUDIX domain-containing protein [Rudanella paleaurantiibacter]